MTQPSEFAVDFPDILDRLRLRLDELSEQLPEFTDDYHRLFLYFVGEHFEDVSPDRIKISDQQKDQKIDFHNVEEDRFAAYQCKLPDLDLLQGSSVVPTYGADLVNEAEDILTFLTDTTGLAKGNKKSQEARNRYWSMKRTSQNTSTRRTKRQKPLDTHGSDQTQRSWHLFPSSKRKFSPLGSRR